MSILNVVRRANHTNAQLERLVKRGKAEEMTRRQPRVSQQTCLGLNLVSPAA